MKQLKLASRIERLGEDMGRMHAIPIPDSAIGDLGLGQHYRVVVRIGSTELRRAILAPKSGQPFVIIGRPFLSDLGLCEGSPVNLKLWADPDPDAVEVAEELLEALAQDDEARARWETFTPGKQRSINHFVASAKQSETRVRRAVDIAEKIRTRTLAGDQD